MFSIMFQFFSFFVHEQGWKASCITCQSPTGIWRQSLVTSDIDGVKPSVWGQRCQSSRGSARENRPPTEVPGLVGGQGPDFGAARSSDHLPPTSAAKTSSLASPRVSESSGYVLSLRRRPCGGNVVLPEHERVALFATFTLVDDVDGNHHHPPTILVETLRLLPPTGHPALPHGKWGRTHQCHQWKILWRDCPNRSTSGEHEQRTRHLL